MDDLGNLTDLPTTRPVGTVERADYSGKQEEGSKKRRKKRDEEHETPAVQDEVILSGTELARKPKPKPGAEKEAEDGSKGHRIDIRI